MHAVDYGILNIIFMKILLFLGLLSVGQLAGVTGLGKLTFSDIGEPGPEKLQSVDLRGKPLLFQVQWSKKRQPTDPPGWYTCEGTAKITSKVSETRFDWQILNDGVVELQKLNGSGIWNFGYIEPSNNYQIRVRVAGSSDWNTQPLVVPKGCGTK